MGTQGIARHSTARGRLAVLSSGNCAPHGTHPRPNWRRVLPYMILAWRGVLCIGLIAVLLSACGGSSSGPTAPAVTPPVVIVPGSATFNLVPARLALAMGDQGALLALRAPGAVTWSSSDTTVASVDAQGLVTALKKGTATISASSAATTATTLLTVYNTSGATPDASSEALIAQALAAKSITAEQALTYRVFALFGDGRLPAQFEGAPSTGSDHLLLRELWTTVADLSPATQDQLRPFLIPPIYANSWFAQRLGLTPEPQGNAAARVVAQSSGTPKKAALAPSTVNCEAQRLPNWYGRSSTAHFNVFYLKSLDPADNARSAEMATLIASVAEEAYAAQTALLNRFPLADTNENCNGGDGAVDIYYTAAALGGLGAWTVGYEPLPGQNACANRPSYIVLNSESIEFLAIRRSLTDGRPLAKSIVAHEFMHVLQFAMARQTSCKDADWFDEATAQWVMDFVVPTIGAGQPGEFGAEQGLGTNAPGLRKSGDVLIEYLYAGHQVSIEKPAAQPKLNGYSDYLFFQYLARTQGPAKIKQIYDAMAGGQNSVESVSAVIDMKAVWPEFAKTLWIGFDEQVLDFWATQDEYRFGLNKVYANLSSTRLPTELQNKRDLLKSLEVDQKGQPRALFTLFKNALEFNSGDYQFDPRSIFYEHLKFTDATVHSVYWSNPIAIFPNNQFMKVQAVKKIAGQWRAPEDWTQESYKQFCLDKKDERLEELILIVSNSEVNRASELPFSIPKLFPMVLSTSNVGCWKWQGTASTTSIANQPVPVDNTGRATVTFEVAATLPGRLRFETSAGLIFGNGSATLGACSVTSVGANRVPVKGEAPPAGTIDMNLDLDLGFGQFGGEPPNRKFLALTGLTTLSTTTTQVCPNGTQVSTFNSSWDWLHTDTPGNYKVSADGQTIEGTFTAVVPGGATINSVWKFTSVRE